MADSTDPFRFTHRVAVRFRDLDPMGHAHHSLPLIYFEEARAAYWREVAGRAGLGAIDYVMGEVSVRFRARVRWPGTVTVDVRVTRLGGKSFDMAYALRAEDATVLATGRSAQVMYDYDAERSRPIPDELRRVIAEFEGIPEASPSD